MWLFPLERWTPEAIATRLAAIVSRLEAIAIRAPSSFLLLVAMPGAPSSVLAPSSKARSP